MDGLPASKSSELKCAVALALNESVTGPARLPESSIAWMRTVPDSAERLMMRTKPCCTGWDAETNNGTSCVAANPIWQHSSGRAATVAARFSNFPMS